MQQFRHAFFAYKHFFADWLYRNSSALSNDKEQQTQHCLRHLLFVCLLNCLLSQLSAYLHNTNWQQQMHSTTTTTLCLINCPRSRCYRSCSVLERINELFSRFSLSLCRSLSFCLSVLSLSALRWCYQHPEQHFGVARCLSLSASNAQITANWVEKRIFTNEQRARGWIGLFTTIQFQYQMRCPRG